jgi:tetratricopeptide (TPR) repeat protein
VSEKFQVTSLDTLAPEEGADDARWFRLRRELDVGAFGVNAYGADTGARVIERHDELGTGAGRHEELYLVLRGSATFELREDERKVGVGEMVFISDPAVRRGAIADEDGTVVLVVGGKPGVPYAVSAWEAATDAFPYWRAGEMDKAVEILRTVVEEHPKAGIVLYNLACAETLLGEHDAAMEHLRRAVEAEDRFRELARNDEDFGAVRERADFREIVAAA